MFMKTQQTLISLSSGIWCVTISPLLVHFTYSYANTFEVCSKIYVGLFLHLVLTCVLIRMQSGPNVYSQFGPTKIHKLICNSYYDQPIYKAASLMPTIFSSFIFYFLLIYLIFLPNEGH